MSEGLPNIALFSSGRTWDRTEDQCVYKSNDGWVITDLMLFNAGEQGRKVSEMLTAHVAKRRGYAPVSG